MDFIPHQNQPSNHRNPPQANLFVLPSQEDSITSVADQWFAQYLDTSASHLVTPDLAPLHIANEYKGKDKLIVGNGTKLHVSHWF